MPSSLASEPSLDTLAAALPQYDAGSMRADAVQDFLSSLVQPLDALETVSVLEASGRVLARDLISPIDVPAHDNSAMDGYAFDGAQLQAGQALTLRVAGTVLAGKPWTGEPVPPGACLRIMTGGVLPSGLNTVVPQELCTLLSQDGGEKVRIPADRIAAGENRRCRGEDLMQGKAALRQGQRLHAAACGLIASLGLAEVPVYRRLKVAYFSTGDEILSLGQAPRPGAVYDSNRYTVCAMLRGLGCEILDLGVVADDPAQLQAAFERAAREADAIITSGGVSVGEADHTKALMRHLGDVAFWRIAMRPGRPMAVGRLPCSERPGRSTILFGLPGNPVAVMVTFLVFVRPALLRMMGAQPQALPLLRARSLEPVRKKPGRTEYQRGIVTSDAQGRLQVQTTGNQGSGVLSSMVQANGLIVLPHDSGSVEVGDEVGVMMLEGLL